MEPVQLAAVLAAAVVLASVISVESGIAVALLELGLGVFVGNVFGVSGDQQWLTFIASFASIVLTFLAGTEVDPDDFRERFGQTMAIGIVSFVGPFVVAWLVSPRGCLQGSGRAAGVRARPGDEPPLPGPP